MSCFELQKLANRKYTTIVFVFYNLQKNEAMAALFYEMLEELKEIMENP